MPASHTVAILGVGVMGQGMARQLLEKRFTVRLWNRTASKIEALAAEGALLAETPAAAVADADFVFAMVADDVASRSVWLEQGALAALKPGAVAIESSTLSIGWIRELAAAATARSIDFIDAPVSGSKKEAASGMLRFLAGGSADAIEKAHPVFDALGRETVPCGPSGSGALIKLINNFMCGVHVAALAEGLHMAESAGMDMALAASILSEGAPGSPIVKMVTPRMVAGDYTPNFFAALMAKDLRYAVQTAQSLGAPLETAPAALALFESAVDQGFGDKDIASALETVRKKGG